MPFSRPGVTTLRTQAIGDIQTEMAVPTLLRRSPLRALGYAVAGVAYSQYGYLDWIARQSVPFTATGEFLEAWAGLVSVLKIDASAANGIAVLGAAAGAGLLVPAGTLLRRGDGAGYVTVQDIQVPGGGFAAVPIVATVQGADGNADAGVALAVATSIAGLLPTAPTLGPVTGGAPIETDDFLRSRMLDRFRAPPQGGASSDYPQWARGVAGVTRAWVNPMGAGAGTVVVYVMLDRAQSAHGGFPQGSDGVSTREARAVAATGDQRDVADALYPKRPVTALVYVAAPIPYPVDFSINPETTVSVAQRAQVVAALTAVFLRKASPLGGPAAVLETSPFEAALVGIAGLPDFTMLAPYTAIRPGTGYLPVLGNVTYA